MSCQARVETTKRGVPVTAKDVTQRRQRQRQERNIQTFLLLLSCLPVFHCLVLSTSQMQGSLGDIGPCHMQQNAGKMREESNSKQTNGYHSSPILPQSTHTPPSTHA